jgi:acylphosphatase
MAQRIETHFRGNVQGVGFRYTAIRIAAGFDVTGYVRNLPDGRVHLVAEGEADELDAFVAAVEEAMAGYIAGRELRRQPSTGEFVRFGVR